MRRYFALGFLTGAVLVPGFGLLIVVIAAGGTFGQRCERMYPNDPVAQERCIAQLASARDCAPQAEGGGT